jgi:hypothetical protein
VRTHSYATGKSASLVPSARRQSAQGRLLDIVSWLLLAVLAIAAARAVLLVILVVLDEASGTINGDTPMYWAVGRGILNGLAPYKDLFETKPPGIFLISAFSMLFPNHAAVAAWLQASALLLIGLPLHLCTWKLSSGMKTVRRLILLMISMLLGSMLSLYAAQRSGDFNVESFGALFGVAYVAVLAWPGLRKSTFFALASAALLCAIGLKEPFLLTCGAGALILCRSWGEGVQRFILPLNVAAIIGFLFMASVGWIDAFLGFYLPEMLSHHVYAQGSLLREGFEWRHMFLDLSVDFPWFGPAIALLLLSMLVLKVSSRHGWLARGWDIVSCAVAVTLCAVAIASGDTFYNHHFVFAVPFYAAAFLVLVRLAAQRELRFSVRAAAVGIAGGFLAVASAMVPLQRYWNVQNDFRFQEATRSTAMQIDTILDRCGVERYLFIGGSGFHPYAYTKHSPVGPMFFQLTGFFDPSRGLLREAFRRQLGTASIAVFSSHETLDLAPEVQRFLEEQFTTAPWDCARNLPPLTRPEYVLWYRKDGKL